MVALPSQKNILVLLAPLMLSASLFTSVQGSSGLNAAQRRDALHHKAARHVVKMRGLLDDEADTKVANAVAPAPAPAPPKAEAPAQPAVASTTAISTSAAPSHSADPRPDQEGLLPGIGNAICNLLLGPCDHSSSVPASVSQTASTHSSSASVANSTSSTASSSSATTHSSAAPSPSTTAAPVAPSQSIAYVFGGVTATVPGGNSIVEPPAQEAGAIQGSLSTGAITALAVIGGSIVFVAIAFTIFRKWKYSKSSRFDARMNPIQWDPRVDGAQERDDGVPGSIRRRQSNASSFFSDDNHHNRANGGATSPEMAEKEAYARSALPDHDFTAGPTAHVGGDYADLTRGQGQAEAHNGHIHFIPQGSH